MSFGLEPTSPSTSSTTPHVYVSQVVTEELTLRSKELESALHSGSIADFCLKKTQSSSETKGSWNFFAANFSSMRRQEILKLLNYEPKSGDEAGLANSMDNLAVTDTFD